MSSQTASAPRSPAREVSADGSGPPLEALRCWTLRDAALLLGTTEGRLRRLADAIRSEPERFYLHLPARPEKGRRETWTPVGKLRPVVDRLQTVLQRIALPDSVMGGRRRRTIHLNARRHLGAAVLLKGDVRKCFPSVSHRAVYHVFRDRLRCSADVSRVLTVLTTLGGCLPTGAPTSPILAALALEELARRLERLAGSHGARFTLWVDDITISGGPRVARLRNLVERVVVQAGFTPHPDKWEVQRAPGEQTVTGIRVGQQLDVPSRFIRKVRRRVRGVEAAIARGADVSERDRNSLAGLLAHLRQLNPGAAKHWGRRIRRALGNPQ